MTPDEYCARKALAPGSSLYYAARVLPADRRRALVALQAFCREVAEVAREVADPGVARLKLAWWATEIDATFGGRPQHPVAQALVPALRAFDLPQAPFHAVIEGAIADCEHRAYPSFATLEAHCRAIAGNVWELSAAICGYRDTATPASVGELGVGLRLAGIVLSVGADAGRGRLYVPEDELARFGVDANALLLRRREPGFAPLMAQQAARARERCATAVAALPAIDRKAQRPALIMAALAAALLEEVRRDGFRVLDRRVALTPLAKAWIAWKASRTR
ncbi:MAG TPA: presqualene diphosphate synthase HpnD [Casimicrobiaceae bacterium]|nr:presqualene diphosphate synthase HpnD [Casimicrobiaceae bacterium]